MGLYKRKDSRFWWMGYTAKGEQRCESTKTSSKDLAKKIWKKREAEIALGRFQIGWPGERMTFAEVCEEFLHSHSSTLSPKSQENHRIFGKHLRAYFGDRKLTEIDERAVVEYRNYRRRQPLKWNPKRTVKGATVNRELACLHCIFQFALKRKYIGENPTSGVKHFNERNERPLKRMLTVEDEHRILEAAPPHLRVAIVLLVQTGGRTYSEGLSLRWDQVDLAHGVIHLGGSVKTTDSAQPLPLSRLACDVLNEWKKEQNSDGAYVFPSSRRPGKPVGSVKRAWRTALQKAGVSYFPIYNLRHVFCTRLSWVAPDAVVQRAMRHSSPETKRHYQLGMVDQVREGIERANEQAYQGEDKLLRFYYGQAKVEKEAGQAS
ncbi:MAG TPA: site-specific integrase [Candidatus Acidoferrales bacterium]|nr:site-specific integrase [Candidatus Acidoferrales bacterium]